MTATISAHPSAWQQRSSPRGGSLGARRAPSSVSHQSPFPSSPSPSEPFSTPASDTQDDQEQEQRQADGGVMMIKKKTNSDRGKEFRAKRKKYEVALSGVVAALRREVDDLHFLYDVRKEKAFKTRNSISGSLALLCRQYFAFFQAGIPNAVTSGHKRLPMGHEDPSAFEERQVAFLHHAMHPDMRMGDQTGVEAIYDQWKRYTSYHAKLRVDVVSVEVSGPEENPIVIVTSNLHVRLSRDTFINVFPHVADNEELIQRLIGKDVTYRGVNQYEFSENGQILIYDSNVDFVGAFLQAGASLEDIALLMNQALIAHRAMLGEEDSSKVYSSPSSPDDGYGRMTAEEQEHAQSERRFPPHRVFEILSEEDDDDEGVYGNNQQTQQMPDAYEPLEEYASKEEAERQLTKQSEREASSEQEQEQEQGEDHEISQHQPASRLDINFLLS